MRGRGARACKLSSNTCVLGCAHDTWTAHAHAATAGAVGGSLRTSGAAMPADAGRLWQRLLVCSSKSSGSVRGLVERVGLVTLGASSWWSLDADAGRRLLAAAAAALLLVLACAGNGCNSCFLALSAGA